MATVPTAPPPHHEQEVVQATLSALIGRIRLAIGVRYASRAVLIASALNIVLLAVWRMWLPAFPVVWAIAGVYVIALIAALIATFRYPVSPLAAARLADERQGLKQRLSSSLALAGESGWANPTFLRLQNADAAASAADLDTRTTLPLRPTWHAGAALVSVLVVVVAAFLAVRSVAVSEQGGGPAQLVMVQEGARLTQDARKIARDAQAQHMPLTARDAQKLAKLGKQMQSRSVSPQAAQQKIASLSAAVKRDQEQAARQSSATATGQAGAVSSATRQATQGGGHAQGAAESKGASQAAPTAVSLSQALQRAAQAINESKLSEGQRQELARSLHRLAEQARERGFNETARDVDAAANALAQSKTGEAVSDLKKAAQAAQAEAAAQQAREAAQRGQAGHKNGAKPDTGNRKAGGQGASRPHGEKPGQTASQGAKPAQPGSQSAQTGQGRSQERRGQGQSQQPGNSGQPGNLEQAGNSEQPGNAAGGQDAQGLARIQNSLRQAAERLSGSSGQSGQPGQSGQGQQSGQAQSGEGQQSGQGRSGSGARQPGGPHGAQPGGAGQSQQTASSGSRGGGPSNVTEGDGRGAPTSPGKFTPSYAPGQKYTTPKQNMGVFHGQPKQLDNYKPSASNRYARMYLPTGSVAGRSTTQNSANPPKGAGSGGQASTVPYYKVYPEFKKGAESAISKEDIPRAYANKVRQYFQSLTPKS